MAEITIKSVEGNPLNINVVMTAVEHSMLNGEIVTETVDFYPDTSKPVRAYLDCTTARKQFCPTTYVDGNIVYLSCDNATAGVYTLTVTCTDTNGKARRYKSDACIEVYDLTSAAEIAGSFDEQTYEMNGVFYTFGGGGTVQSDWDETNPESPAYILNKPDLSDYATDEELQAVEEQIPNVPEWAQQPQKPSYTAGEVGAVPTSRTVNGKALSEDITLNAQDVGAQMPIADIAQIREGAAKGATAYQKPSTGIAKSDLTNGIQQSLDRADTALQAAALTPLQNQINTINYKIPSDATSTNKLADKNYVERLVNEKQDTINDLDAIRRGAAKGATAYQLPSNGMPKTDLAVGVQQSLDKANTAYQKPSAGIPKTDLAQEIQQRLDIPIDDEPTAGSNNLVKSGGVYNELVLGAVYDVSSKNPTAGPNNDGKWESLSALLSDANLYTIIPTSVRKGGMSIKFVQSSDNKYVQYIYTGTSTDAADFTNTANWQKMNLEEEVIRLGSEVTELSFTEELNNYGSVEVDETGADSGFYRKSINQMVHEANQFYKCKVIKNVPINKISWDIPSEYGGIGECYAVSVANGLIVSLVDVIGAKEAGILPLRGDWGAVWDVYLNFWGAGFVDKYTLSAECGVDDTVDKILRGNVNFSNAGYLNPNNGAFVLNQYWLTTDFIPVVPGESITVQSNSYASCLAAFYDEDKVFQSYLSQQNNQIESNTIIVPDGAYYMRCASALPYHGYLIFNDAPYSKLSELANKENAPIVIGDNAIKVKNIDPIGEAVTAAEATISTAITDKYYSLKTTGYVISEVAAANLGSMVVENIEVGKRYYLKIAQEIDTSMYRNYFIFAKSATESVITASEIPNYVQLIDNTEHIYLITIPEGCTRVYTAGYTATFNTFWVKDMETKTLEWLKVNAGNIDKSVISRIINAVESKNVKLFDSINKPIVFSGKQLVAFGDSVTWGVASPGLVNAGENKYISLFCTHIGATLANYAKSGACITDGQNEIESIHTTLTNYTGNADIIWIAGGINDWQAQAPIGSFADSGTTTLYGALNAMCDYIKTNYPNAVVIFVTPIPTTSTTTFGVDHPDNLSQYRKAIQEVAASNGFNVVDGASLGLPDTMSDFGNTMFAPTDCVHPTLAGHAMYARSLAGKLL